MNKWKAKLRAWLIEIVREAIRIERGAGLFTSMPSPTMTREAIPKASLSPTILAVISDFEQMQSESIAEQVKYYEPKQL